MSADFVRRMERVREDAGVKSERARTIMKTQYDKHRRTLMEYQPGDMVWLSAAHIPSNRPSKKLDHKFLGPYKVVRKMGASAYQLTTQGQTTRHATFNEQLLKPYKKGGYPSQVSDPPPPAELKDGEDEWEVESVKDSRYSRGQLQYLVHWKGYDVSEDTWEPARHLTHTRELVNDFHASYPNKPKPRRRQVKSRGRDSLRRG